jgi:hypothetical protein
VGIPKGRERNKGTVFPTRSVSKYYKQDKSKIETKAFRTFITIYSLFKIDSLSANIKLTFRKSLIRSVMTYACPARELAADTYNPKLQRMHNKFLRNIGNFPRCTPVRDLHTAFTLPYACDYITKLCRRQAEVIQNHENEHVRGIGQGEARHRKYKRRCSNFVHSSD